MGPDPAVAAIRLAIRAALTESGLPGAGPAERGGAEPGRVELEPGELVLAACSGGPDSLALAAALAFEAPRLGLRAGGITVDHGLQPGSAAQARAVTQTLAGLGLDPVLSVTATVAQRGHDPRVQDQASPDQRGQDQGAQEPDSGQGGQGGLEAGRRGREGAAGGWAGPEAAARAGRYAALDTAAADCGAAVILLGHTRDDEAEGVLLGLARGSGTRSLAGMAPRSGRYRRPLLEVSRAQTEAACAAQGLIPWQDPHNTDPAYTRVRVRHQVLPDLAAALGPGIPAALARTARALRIDADYLDEQAAAAFARAGGPGAELDASALAGLPEAIRSRVLRLGALAAGCPGGALTAAHVAALDELVTRWHGQQGVDLPGGIRGRRAYGKLTFTDGCAPPGAAVRRAAADAGRDDCREDADGRE
jgi:tRNA(Ile)-lysidine synthase